MEQQQPESPPQKPKDPPKKARAKRPAKVRTEDFATKVNVVADENLGRLVLEGWVEDPEAPTGQRKVTQPITDCLIDVQHLSDEDGVRAMHVVIRKLTVLDDGERVWEQFPGIIDAVVMEDCRKWNAWATTVAGANWNLVDATRWELKKYLFAQENAKNCVFSPSCSGFIADHGVWLARPYSVDAATNAWPVRDEDDVVDLECLDGATRRFRIPQTQTLGLTLATGYELTAMPTFGGIPPEEHRAVEQLVIRARENLGHQYFAVALGWLCASAGWSTLVRACDSFPVLYVTGVAGCGKDTFCRWLMRVCGQNPKDVINITGTTFAGVRDAARKVGNVPLWVNELRRNDESRRLEGWIRSMFDAQGAVMGRMRGQRERDLRPRRALMLSGQSILGSDAELSRYLLLHLPHPPERRALRQEVEDLLPAAHRAWSFAAAQVATWPEGTLRIIIEKVKEDLLKSSSLKLKDRQLYCYAVACLGLGILFHGGSVTPLIQGSVREAIGAEIWETVLGGLREGHIMAEQEGLLGRFWETLQINHARGRLMNQKATQWCRLVRSATGTRIALWVPFLIRSAMDFDRHEKWDRTMLRQEIMQINGFEAQEVVQRMTDGHVRACMMFNAQQNALPGWVNDLANVVEAPDGEG